MSRNAEEPISIVNPIGDGPGTKFTLSSTTEKNDLINFVFPDAVLRDPAACRPRGIFAATNEQVDEYNSILLDRVQGESKRYFAADSLKDVPDSDYILNTAVLDFVAAQTPHGLPPHSMEIKKNAVYRLLRTFSFERQLVENAKVVVTELGRRIVTVKLLRNLEFPGFGNAGEEEEVLIPRVHFFRGLDSGHTLSRLQFPLAPGYSTVFECCEGQTYDKVGIDLTRPVTRGQLYMALSRVRRGDDVMLRLRPGDSSITY